MDTKLFRVGLIGCGLRGIWHLHNWRKSGMKFSLVSVADPDKHYADFASRLFADGGASYFNDGIDLLRSSDIDAVIIASPNHVHCGPAIMAMRRGVKLFLEKPVATAFEDMADMWSAKIESGANPVIGFCLRYAPFYAKIKEIVAAGTLGELLIINAEEMMSDDLSMLFARGDWRPNGKMTGGLMLEKCCHDMDLLNWLVDSRAEKVSSFAERTALLPKPDASDRCGTCNLASTCRFKHGALPEIFEAHWPAELHGVLGKLDNDSCIFSSSNTYPDHQVLNIRYANGVLCNFTVAQCQPATRRTIHIIGSAGRLYGVVNHNRISIYRHGTLGEEVVENIDVYPDASGHNGADSVLTRDLIALLEERPNPDRPGLEEGIEAALLCLAADESANLAKPISISPLRERVFGNIRISKSKAPSVLST